MKPIIETKGSISDNESLCVPLTKLIKDAEYDSGFNMVHIVTFIVCIFLPDILFALQVRMQDPHEKRIMSLVCSFIIWFFIFIGFLSNAISARRTLKLLEKCADKDLKLTATGVEFPVALLLGTEDRQFIAESGKMTLNIKWEDIVEWGVFDGGRYTPRCYTLKLKYNIKETFSNYLNLQRNFTKSEEKDILNFVQRFLPVKITRRFMLIKLHTKFQHVN